MAAWNLLRLLRGLLGVSSAALGGLLGVLKFLESFLGASSGRSGGPMELPGA